MEKRPVMGELLLKGGLLSPENLDRALEAQRHQGGRLGYHLLRLGILDVEQLSDFLRDSMGLIPHDLVSWVRDLSVLEEIPAGIAQFYQVMPVEKKGAVLTVALADLENPRIIPALEELTGLSIDPVICPRAAVVTALEHFYGISRDPGVVKQEAGDHLFIVHLPKSRIRALHGAALKADSAAADWLRAILAESIHGGCRTLFIRPSEEGVLISMRTRNGLETRYVLDGRKRQEMETLLMELSRIKDRKRGGRLEGRIRLQVENRFLSLRVSAMHTLLGIRFTLTLYDERHVQGDWKTLVSQLTGPERSDFEGRLGSPSGMLLLAGPPGAGLSAVYYALLLSLKQAQKQVLALEEYVLFPVAGVSQAEVSRLEGASWPELILQALRQEPDCLAVFPLTERRSVETALLAASHIPVLGVLHQPTAAAALNWLLENQFKSALKAGVLKGILTIASLPTLCPHCRLPLELTSPAGQRLTLHTRQGCEKCLAWDTLPTEEVLEWLPVVPGRLPLEGGKFDVAQTSAYLRDRGGVPLSQRVLQRAQEGHVDGAEIREYL